MASDQRSSFTSETYTFGIHARYSQAREGLAGSIQEAKNLCCNAIQIFIKTNLRWSIRKNLVEGDLIRPCQDQVQKIFVHSIYLTNLGSENPETRRKSIESLINEIELASKMKLDAIVIHLGYSSLGTKDFITSLNKVLSETSEMPILLENSAGQSRALGSRLEILREVRDRVVDKSRVYYCIDSAHLFAAGYDIVPETYNDIDRILGRQNIKLIHLNDSKVAFNGGKDIHESLGKGKIGYQKIKGFVLEYKDIPLILETKKYKEDLEMLRSILCE
jgi:deoxyribonuclease-4